MPLLFGAITASNQQARADKGVMFPIAMVNVGSAGAANIDFTSIPSTYTHLQLRMNIQTNRPTYSADNMYIRFNGDSSGGHYSRHQLIGDGTSASAGAAASQDEIFIGSISSSVEPNSFGGSVLDIVNYASTIKNKTTRTLTGYYTNSYYAVCAMAGAWYSTAAINRITIYPQSGTAFTQNTQVALYGIKGA